MSFSDPDGDRVELAHWVGSDDPTQLDMSRASDQELIACRARAPGRRD